MRIDRGASLHAIASEMGGGQTLREAAGFLAWLELHGHSGADTADFSRQAWADLIEEWQRGLVVFCYAVKITDPCAPIGCGRCRWDIVETGNVWEYLRETRASGKGADAYGNVNQARNGQYFGRHVEKLGQPGLMPDHIGREIVERSQILAQFEQPAKEQAERSRGEQET